MIDVGLIVLGGLGAAVVAAVLYLGIYGVLRGRRQRPRWPVMLAEYTLVGWALLFAFITQVIDFGTGMGEQLNLVPLHSFWIAFTYGTINTVGLPQFALNILMMVPLGVLLPIVARRFRTLWAITAVAVLVPLVTEFIQYFSGRHADIDDVIANAVGVLVGFALWVILHAMTTARHRQIPPLPNAARAAVAALFLVAVIAPFGLVALVDGAREGTVYYGSFSPTGVQLKTTVSDQTGTGDLYKVAPVGSRDELIDSLTQNVPLSEPCSDDDRGDTTCHLSNAATLYIHDYNRWGVVFDRVGEPVHNVAGAPTVTEAEARTIAAPALEQLGIDVTELVDAGLGENFGEGIVHIQYAPASQPDHARIWGMVEATVDAAGTLLDVDDNRVRADWVKTVPTISPSQALNITQEIGVQKWDVPAIVTSVTPSFYLDESSDYLIPTWKFGGTMGLGNPYLWHPNVDARQH